MTDFDMAEFGRMLDSRFGTLAASLVGMSARIDRLIERVEDLETAPDAALFLDDDDAKLSAYEEAALDRS